MKPQSTPLQIATLSLLTALAVACSSQSPQSTQSGLSSDGHEHGNGGDQLSPSDSTAWFLGADRVIRVCIEKDANFPESESVIQSETQRAFETWRKYFVDRVVNEPGQMVYQDPQNQMSYQTQFIGKCDGSQDLAIYLGVSNPSLDQERQQFTNPVGYALRDSYDVAKGWGKGHIWIALRGADFDWSKPGTTQGILLHEIGHVWGCEHTPNTIMTKDIANLLHSYTVSYGGINDTLTSGIDNNGALRINSRSYESTGFIDKDAPSLGIQVPASDPEIRAKLEKLSDSEGRLTLQDGRVFPIHVAKAERTGTDGPKAFSIDVDNSSRTVRYYEPSGAGLIEYGTIRAQDGSKHVIQITSNQSIPFQKISLMTEEGPVELYESVISEW